MSKQNKAYLFAGASILAWSTISTAFKLALNYLTPVGLLFFASLTAFLFLGIVNAVSNPSLFKTKALFKTVGRNLKISFLRGLLNPFIYYLMLFEAYSRLRAQEAQALNYTWAIVLALFSIWLLKEKFRIIDFVSLLISFFGVWVISTKGQITSLQFDDALGSFLAVSTSIIWAFYWILNIKDKRPALTKLNYNFFLGFLFIALFALFTHKSLFTPQAIYGYGILGGIYVGIFEMGLTFLLWNKALEFTDNTAVISNLIFFTPFLSLLFISSVLKESIHYATFIGLLLIVFSNLLQKGLPAILKRNE